MHSVVVEGWRTYISWYADGSRVVDFKNPRKPKGEVMAMPHRPIGGSGITGL